MDSIFCLVLKKGSTKELDMPIKSILFGILTVVTFIGCTKTSQFTATKKPEQVIEKEVQFKVDGADVEMHMIVNGEELEELPADMMQYVMQMVDGHDSSEYQWELEKKLQELQIDFENNHAEMDDFQREELQLEMEHLRRELDTMDYPDFSEVWQYKDPYIDQGSEFIEKMFLSEEIANVLSDKRAVSIFCIWEARQHMEPQERIEALFPIMINNQVDMAVRNAAAMVVRQSFYEIGDRSKAIETLRNQILANEGALNEVH